MKLRNLFYLLLALPLAFAACENLGDQATSEAKLTVTTTSEEFELDGGAGLINYTLVNAPAGAKVQASCEADWVSNFNVAETYITYTVAVNTGEARETKIVVSYEAQSFEVAVTQAGKAEGVVSTTLEVLTESPVECSCQGQVYSIEYKLENPVEGKELEVKANVDWISNFVVTESLIEFGVATNYGEEREGTITLTYGILDPITVTVKQSVAVPELVIYSADDEFTAEGGTGEIAFGVVCLVEPEAVAATADVEWLTIDSIEGDYVKFTVAANETEETRKADVTLTSGELTATVTITQYHSGFDPNLIRETLTITSMRAQAVAADTWELILFETHPVLGEPQSRIVVKMAEANTFCIIDGTYTMAEGGIIANDATVDQLGGSYFRYTGTGAPMDDATLTIAIDKENEKAVISGTFLVGNTEYSFEWDGAVEGFIYQEIGDEGITEWDFFFIYNQWGDTKYVVAYDTNKVKYEWYVTKLGGTKSSPLAAGEYVVGEWENTTTRDYIDNSSSRINGNNLVSGVVNITVVEEGYNFTFDVTDTNGTNWKGTYVGDIDTDLFNSNPYEPKTF